MSIVAPSRAQSSTIASESAKKSTIQDTPNHVCTNKAAALDAELFTAPYFLIDAENRKISEMLECRPDQTNYPVVGTVHPNLVAIDLDLDDEAETDWALHHLVTWCEDHGTWYAHRASGGGPGRSHFLALPHKRDRDNLINYIERMRIDLGVSRTHIDVRDKLRLLSSPHRHGHTRGNLFTAPGTLPKALLSGEAGRQHSDAYISQATRAPEHDTADELTSGQWHIAATLDCQDAIDQSRSGIEFLIALRLKAKGASAHAVFNALSDPSLRDDIGKAAEQGFTWFYTHVWEKIDVEPAISAARTYDWTIYALPMSRAVREVWSSWPTRHKHTVEHVAVVAAARIGAHGSAGGPLPIRDLVEDTGIDKDTVCRALKTLREHGLLTRTERFTITQEVATNSDRYALGTELVPASLTPTTSLYTQLPYSPADSLWLGLPPAALSATLSLLHSGQALPLAALLRQTGYSFLVQPSTRQKTLGRQLLATLQTQNLLQTTDPDIYELNGAIHHVERPISGFLRWKKLRKQHREERKSFRDAVAAVYEMAHELKTAWKTAQLEAIERNKQQRRAGQERWWASLSPERCARRREIYKETWANSTFEERQARLDKLERERPKSEVSAREPMFA